jgi:hypothetical protein
LQFGYIWTNCKHKWTSRRIYEDGAFDFQEVSIGCKGHQMSFSMLVETQGNVPYSWIFNLTNSGDCWIAIET